MQGRSQTSRGSLGAGKPHTLAPGSTHRRRHLHHGFHGRVQNGIHNTAHVIASSESARRAVGDALTAQRAAGIGDGQIVTHDHLHRRAYAREVPHAAMLHLVADGHAAHALDALAAVALQRKIGIPRLRHRQGLVGILHVEGTGKEAQGAGVLTHARGTQGAMAIHDGLQVRPTRRSHLRGVGAHHHALGRSGIASRHQTLALHLYQAHPARANAVQILQIAQRGNVNARGHGGFKQRGALGHLHSLAVQRDGYHTSSPLPVSAPMPYTSHRRQRRHS